MCFLRLLWQAKTCRHGRCKDNERELIRRIHEVKAFHDREVRWAWSFHEFVFFQVQGVMYGIGPSSHYEVIPVKLVALESGRRLPIARRNYFIEWRHLGASSG